MLIGLRLTTAKMSIISNSRYRFNKIPSKIPAGSFVNIDKVILKCIWEGKGTRIAKTILTHFFLFQDVL